MIKKLKGYSSIILIIFITILVITISFIALTQLQKTIIMKNNIINLQSRYITESYLNYCINDFINNYDYKNYNIQLNDNLFNELGHSISDVTIEVADAYYQKIPSCNIKVSSNYKNIKTKASSILSKYNKVFFMDKNERLNMVNYINFEEEYNKYLNILKESVNEGIVYSGNSNNYNFREGEFLVTNNSQLLSYYIYANQYIPVDSYRMTGNFNFTEDINIGLPNENTGTVTLFGIFYITGNINLYENVVLNGIVISNGGSINPNGYSCQISGNFIELNPIGSYPIDDIDYNLDNIYSYINSLENAKYIEVLNYKINPKD